MAIIDRYIANLEVYGLKIKNKSNRSATFIYKDHIEFHGKVKWNGGFEISNINKPDEFEDLTRRVNILQKLRKSKLVSEKFITGIAEPLFDDDLSALQQAFIKANIQIIFNLKSNYDDERNGALKLKYLLVIIPRSSRLEFIADLEAIIHEMKNDNCHKFYIVAIVALHIASVIYHAFFFKLKGYFYHDPPESKNS